MSSSSSDGSAFQVLRAVDGVRRSESTADGSERFNSWLPGRDTAQHSPESYRVIGGMASLSLLKWTHARFAPLALIRPAHIASSAFE